MTSVLLSSLQGPVSSGCGSCSGLHASCWALCEQHARHQLCAPYVVTAAVQHAKAPHVQVVPREDVEQGFTNLVNSLEDLQLDVPDAVDLLARFILRAITDEVLSPAFTRLIPGGGCSLPFDSTALLHITAALHGPCVQACWCSCRGISHAGDHACQSVSCCSVQARAHAWGACERAARWAWLASTAPSARSAAGAGLLADRWPRHARPSHSYSRCSLLCWAISSSCTPSTLPWVD